MLLIPIITWWTESRTCVSHKYMFPHTALLLNQTNYHPYQPLIRKVKGILIYSQGWHNSPVADQGEGVRGPRLPPYTLSKMRTKGPKKIFFETAPPLPLGLDDWHLPCPPLPYLKDWICHCSIWGDQDPGKYIPNTLQTFHFHFTKIRICSTKCQILCLCYPLSFVFLLQYSL